MTESNNAGRKSRSPPCEDVVDWELDRNRDPLTPQNPRDTPELRALSITTKIVAGGDNTLRALRDGFARVIEQQIGCDAVGPEEMEKILELLAIRHQRPRSGAPVHPTPDTVRHGTIDRELQETARMPRQGVCNGSPSDRRRHTHTDPAQVPIGRDPDQAPVTFTTTKSDRSVRSDTKHPQPRAWSRTGTQTNIPRTLVRQLPARPHASVVASASSAFSHRSDNSTNDYMGRAPTEGNSEV
jgi:hypothetical protein